MADGEAGLSVGALLSCVLTGASGRGSCAVRGQAVCNGLLAACPAFCLMNAHPPPPLPSPHPTSLAPPCPLPNPADAAQVAIFDATNTTVERRNYLRQRFHGKWQYMFVESICNDSEVGGGRGRGWWAAPAWGGGGGGGGGLVGGRVAAGCRSTVAEPALWGPTLPIGDHSQPSPGSDSAACRH